ncbi:MAG: AtpZ/AtpI family protein [Bacteroidales bacterium]|jgi:F0F1-type ATP synthase assembly protein I|nr:AtpZ/AtpI family protein [Bacteroidales bacterium]
MEEQRPNQKREKNKGEGGLQAYSRYSAIAIEMAVIIILTSLGGVKLDKAIGTEPLFTVILSLLGVAAAIWLVIREAVRNK